MDFGELFEPQLTAASYAKMEGFVINTKSSIFLLRFPDIAASQLSRKTQFPTHFIGKLILAIGE